MLLVFSFCTIHLHTNTHWRFIYVSTAQVTFNYNNKCSDSLKQWLDIKNWLCGGCQCKMDWYQINDSRNCLNRAVVVIRHIYTNRLKCSNVICWVWVDKYSIWYYVWIECGVVSVRLQEITCHLMIPSFPYQNDKPKLDNLIDCIVLKCCYRLLLKKIGSVFFGRTPCEISNAIELIGFVYFTRVIMSERLVYCIFMFSFIMNVFVHISWWVCMCVCSMSSRRA